MFIVFKLLISKTLLLVWKFLLFKKKKVKKKQFDLCVCNKATSWKITQFFISRTLALLLHVYLVVFRCKIECKVVKLYSHNTQIYLEGEKCKKIKKKEISKAQRNKRAHILNVFFYRFLFCFVYYENQL